MSWAKMSMEQQIKSLEKQIKELKAWKESAMKVFPDYQAIGKLIGTRLGHGVNDEIIPFIRSLITQNTRFREACEELCSKAFVDAERTKFIIPPAFEKAVRLAKQALQLSNQGEKP